MPVAIFCVWILPLGVLLRYIISLGLNPLRSILFGDVPGEKGCDGLAGDFVGG